jgi:hypothetical protein
MTLLKKWFPTYLREIERIEGWEREPLVEPRNYTTRNSFDDLVGEEMPKCVVLSPGLFQVPTHPESNGYYNAVWQLGVGVACAAPNEELADQMVKMYGAAARAILLQHQDLEREEEDVIGVQWLDENYEDLPIEDQLMLYKYAAIYCGVEAEKVTSRFMRPPFVDESAQILDQIEEVILELPDYDLTVTNT